MILRVASLTCRTTSEHPMRSLLVVSFVLAIFSPQAGLMADEPPPNPYGVAGWGVLGTLGMPADCLDYDWNNLRPGTLAQMCRPNHYYDVVGIPHRWWGYNQVTNEINDPDQFAQWLASNPGHVWIIGNEPDLASQDGLTREQYAHMYKTYYDFISQHDPTARFCIGAITGGSTTDRLNDTKGWYEYVLNYYKNTYGQPMHIDIWNIHSYCGPAQIEDPDQPIRDFVTPFIDWCHNVDDGRYAGCEVWITELPLGEWFGALSEDWIIWFAQRYLPRLERAGISRWFWFVSRDSGEWATVALVKGSVVSPLGQAYADLANGFPNEVIPVAPYVPDPTPACFEDDFASGQISHPWTIKAGKWAVEDGVLRQSRTTYPWTGETVALQYLYQDFDASMRIRINAAAGPTNWAGVLFRAASRFHHHSHSGYLVYLRQNGAIGLYNRHEGTMREVSNAVADTAVWQDLRIQAAGWRIRVWVNGESIIDYTDTQQRFAQGYTILHVLKSDSSYDDVQIFNAANATPEIVASTISKRWLVADDSTPYTATLLTRDTDGADQIVYVRTYLFDQSPSPDNGRGCLAWAISDDQIAGQEGQWSLMGDAVGGGRWAWRNDAWGADTYITPISASTATQGNERTVTFTFSVKPAWAPAANQRLHSTVRDSRGDSVAGGSASFLYGIHRFGPGDLDGDGHVDQSDFGLFQSCYSGPGIAQTAPSCAEARLDGDDDVDLEDFTIFLGCFRGPGCPADPLCGD
jgi:hypothetical protein